MRAAMQCSSSAGPRKYLTRSFGALRSSTRVRAGDMWHADSPDGYPAGASAALAGPGLLSQGLTLDFGEWNAAATACRSQPRAVSLRAQVRLLASVAAPTPLAALRLPLLLLRLLLRVLPSKVRTARAAEKLCVSSCSTFPHVALQARRIRRSLSSRRGGSFAALHPR